MTPARLVECMTRIRWSPPRLADAFGCDEDLIHSWILGFEGVPSEAEAWIQALATVHEAMERTAPTFLRGGRMEEDA